MQLNETVLWLDMQLSPLLARWIQSRFSIKAISAYQLFINTESDETIFLNAKKEANVIIISKDKDFPDLIGRYHSPPKLVWLRMGNRSNKKMVMILEEVLLPALEETLNTASEIVEII